MGSIPTPGTPLFRSVRAPNLDADLVAVARDADAPGVAADLAVLDVAAADVQLDVDLDLFTAIRAGHQVRVVHASDDSASLTWAAGLGVGYPS